MVLFCGKPISGLFLNDLNGLCTLFSLCKVVLAMQTLNRFMNLISHFTFEARGLTHVFIIIFFNFKGTLTLIESLSNW